MTSNYYSAYEEPDDFRPQKRLKIDTSKEKDLRLDDKEHVSSDTTLVKTKLHKEFTPNVSKTEVSLVNAELWKKLNEMGNEMVLDRPFPKKDNNGSCSLCYCF